MPRGATHFEVVQIGAHLAEESAALAERGAACLFVEPVPELFAELRNRFAAFPNVVLENVAVAGSAGLRRIHYLRDTAGLPFWADQIGSLREGHIFDLAGQAGFDTSYRDRLVSCEIRCVTLAELFTAHSISQVENLLVDTEGFDYEILSEFDFSTALVRRLVFERKHMDGVRNTGYRYNHLVDKLLQVGYVVRHVDHQNDEALLTVNPRELKRRILAYNREQMLGRAPVSHQSRVPQLFVAHKALSRAKRPSARPLPTTPEHGVVYLALGRRHLLEARQSVGSLRVFHPDLPITIFTDQLVSGRTPANCRYLDTSQSPFKQKIAVLLQSPYRRTLFLDTDTAVVDTLDPLFGLLHDYEWCIAEAPRFHFEDGEFFFDAYHSPGVFNTGVIAFERNDSVRRLLETWAAAIAPQPDAEIRPGHRCDQWYFNSAVTGTDAFRRLRVFILNNVEWNLRSYAVGQAAREDLLAAARILHARLWEVHRFWSLNLAEIVRDLQLRRATPAHLHHAKIARS